MSEVHVVSRDRAGLELDEYLCLLFPEWNKGFLRRQVRDGRVLVDGAPALPSKRLRADQVLLVDIDRDGVPQAPVAPGLELAILHETDDWMVVAKPAGLAVEPERWAREAATLSGALLSVSLDRASDPERGVDERYRLVHRIDKDTSGAVLVAKHLEAERGLRVAFEQGRVEKSYLALVEGEYPLADGEEDLIDLPIGPDGRRSGRMAVSADASGKRRKRTDDGGKPSRTRVSVERRFRGYTLLRCEPLTGRTHQIRVHLSHVGFPLAVDRLYGRNDELLLSRLKHRYKTKRGQPERPLMGRLTLHAERLGVPDLGQGGDPVRVTCPLPKDFQQTLRQLERHRSRQA